jgi:hypothetical protein
VSRPFISSDLHQQAGPKTKATIEANIVPMKGSETGEKKTTKEQTCSTSPPAGNSRAFDPDTIFYATETGAYFVDVGTHYRAYTRKTPIKAGIRRHLERQGTSENDMGDLLAMHIDNIELDRAADWVGGLAGHNRGLMSHQGDPSSSPPSRTSPPERKESAHSIFPSPSKPFRTTMPAPSF